MKDWTKWILTTTILSMSVAPITALAAGSSDSEKSALGLTFKDYTDISPDKVKAVQEAVNQGLLSGFPDGQFQPKQMLSRQEFAVLLAKALHLLPDATSRASFADTRDAWGAPYIEAVRKAGLMSGDDANSFRPDDAVTREELATVFVRAVKGTGAKGEESNLVVGEEKVSDWAGSAVKTSAKLGLVVPTADGFQPKATIEREDIAAFLLDIFKREEHTAVINKIDGDFVTIDGQSYLIDERLKALFAGKNKEALEGAILKYTSLNKNVDDLAELEIVKSGNDSAPVSLDTSGSSFKGVLRIAGDHVAVKGDSFAQVEVKQGVKSLELSGNVEQLAVLTKDALQLTGTAAITTLKVDHEQAQVSLGKGVLVDTVRTPDAVKASKVIVNYEQTKEQIKNRDPEASSSTGSSSKKSQTVTALPIEAPNGIVGGSPVEKGLKGVFSGGEGSLTYTAVSSDPAVATVQVSGGKLSLAPLKAGSTTITVTGTYSGGLSGQRTFVFTVVPNEAPGVSQQKLTADDGEVNSKDVTVDVSEAFTDEEVSSLTYTAVSSDPTVATVSVNGSTLSLTSLKIGTTEITVTATDFGGLTKTRTFVFTVANAKPKASSQSLTASNGQAGGKAVTVQLGDAFEDEDVKSLTYTVTSSDPSVATASLLGTTLTLNPLSQGKTTITVTAKDTGGLSVERAFEFTVTPPNQAPSVTLKSLLPSSNGQVGGSDVTVDLDGAFTDEDANSLTYTVTSSDPTVATASVKDNIVSLASLKAGTTTITVTAEDSEGLKVDRTFVFTVDPAQVEASLQNNAALYMSLQSGDVNINTSESSYKYGKRNIKDLIKLKRLGNTLTDITYDGSQGDFDVKDGGVKVADVALESDSDKVVISSDATQIKLVPKAGINEQTAANLTFHVKTVGGKTTDVVLPITIDQTAPTVTNAVYDNNYSEFTFTFNEEVIKDENGVFVNTMFFSPSGSGSDNITLQKDIDYTLQFVGGSTEVKLMLNNTGMQKLSIADGSVFSFPLTGISDRAYNEMTAPYQVTVQNYSGGGGSSGSGSSSGGSSGSSGGSGSGSGGVAIPGGD